MNDERDAAIALLTERITKIEKALAMSSGANATQPGNSSIETARLSQNIPNPFNETTNIKYYIPENTKQSHILVTDMSGKTVKQQLINTRGNGQIMLNAAELSSGTYGYSLYSNGKLIDTKKMVIIK